MNAQRLFHSPDDVPPIRWSRNDQPREHGETFPKYSLPDARQCIRRLCTEINFL